MAKYDDDEYLDDDIKVVISERRRNDDRDEEGSVEDYVNRIMDDALTDALDENYRLKDIDRAISEANKPAKPHIMIGPMLHKHIVALGVSLLILAVVITVFVRSLGNNYRTPVETHAGYMNKESFNNEERSYAYANGLSQKQMKKLRNRLHDSYDYMKALNQSKSDNEEEYHKNCQLYGDDFEYRIRILTKTLIEDNKLMSYENELTYIAEDLTSTPFIATKSEELSDAMADVMESFMDNRITKGYDMECELVVSGSRLSEPKTEQINLTALKINGRWILWDDIYEALKIQY